MEKIFLDGKVVALKISSMPEGSVPATEPGDPLQVLTLKYQKGRLAALHRHVPHARQTAHLQECFIVVRGKIRIFFFDEATQASTHTDVPAGQTCLSLGGPHAVEFLEDAEVIEVKNGPFFDDKEFIPAQLPLA